MQPEGLCQWKIDTIGNRTCDLPACSVVPQPTAPPRALVGYVYIRILLRCMDPWPLNSFVPIGWDAYWAPELLWEQWRKRKFSVCTHDMPWNWFLFWNIKLKWNHVGLYEGSVVGTRLEFWFMHQLSLIRFCGNYFQFIQVNTAPSVSSFPELLLFSFFPCSFFHLCAIFPNLFQ